MPSDVPGIRPSGSPGVPPASQTSRVAPSRALVPASPVAPRPADSLRGSPLGRSGLDLEELFATFDQIATRQRTPALALEVGLEQARGALVRNLAGEALAALDMVWEGARATEEGWYLRSGALSVLGMPAESDRVAEEGLVARPGSAALRFLQSLAKLAIGDVAGAKAVLLPAVQQRPNDPLLLVQLAVVTARQGDTNGADALLQRAALAAPGHPATEYGRSVVRMVSAEFTRQSSRPTPHETIAIGTPRFGIPVFDAADEHAASANETTEIFSLTDASELGDGKATDSVGVAFETIGARVVSSRQMDVAREVRLLATAFSVGGTLVAAGRAGEAHAARILLTALASALTGEGSDASPPLRSLLQQIVVALQTGRATDAERLTRKATQVVREPTVRLLQMLVRGAVQELSRRSNTRNSGSHEAATDSATIVRGQAAPNGIVAVRLGLGLLEETPELRAQVRASTDAIARTLGDAAGHSRPMHAPDRFDVSGPYTSGAYANGKWASIPTPGFARNAWAGVYAPFATRQQRDETPSAERAGANITAAICVLFAAAAVATGHPIVAIAFGASAAWLASRRGR